MIVVPKVQNSAFGTIKQQIARYRPVTNYILLRSSCKLAVALAACIHLVSSVNRNGSKSVNNEGR